MAVWIVLGAVSVALVAALLYWLLIITEGTYLGTRVVILLYDWTAKRYDSIKDLQYVNEVRYVALPIASSLGSGRQRLLDVATGTGRVPLALTRGTDRNVMVVGVDRSQGMLSEARAALGTDMDGSVSWLCGDATGLPFADETFDVVTCLEALEFVVKPQHALRELARVLTPGGTLWLSNRVGWESHLFPGRLATRGRLESALSDMGMIDIDTRRWQVHYDLVRARKPWLRPGERALHQKPASPRTGKDPG